MGVWVSVLGWMKGWDYEFVINEKKYLGVSGIVTYITAILYTYVSYGHFLINNILFTYVTK